VFYYCSSLQTISLPSLKTIDASYKVLEIFAGSAIQEASFEALEDVHSYLFSGASALVSVNLPSAKTIEKSAFEQLSQLTSVNIPMVTEIQTFAFNNCEALTSLSMEEVTRIESCAFQSSGLQSVYAPKLKVIDGDAFNQSKALKSFVSETLEEIMAVGNYGPFAGAPIGLIDLSTVHTISGQRSILYGIQRAAAVIFRSNTPPSLETANNLYTPNVGVKFYVPDDAVEAYKTAENWSAWASIIHPLSEYMEPTE
jgi:hypothetical protein